MTSAARAAAHDGGDLRDADPERVAGAERGAEVPDLVRLPVDRVGRSGGERPDHRPRPVEDVDLVSSASSSMGTSTASQLSAESARERRTQEIVRSPGTRPRRKGCAT